MKLVLRNNRMPMFLLSAGLVFLCAIVGCQTLPRSGFDPSGQRLFESRPLADCPLLQRRSTPSPTTTTSTPTLIPQQQASNGPVNGASIFAPPPVAGQLAAGQLAALPGNLGAARTNPAVPQHGSTATTLPPGTHAVTTALIHNPATQGTRPVFADTGGYALPTVPVTGPALIMTPREQIAPLGSEVVLIASRLGVRDRLVTNEKIEWSLEGVGTIEKIDTSSCADILFLDHVKAKKVSGHYAITKTSNRYQTLDRGTPGTADDVHLLRGQTWVSVNSMREGTTHVTAFAPNMSDWSRRTDVGIIHWVDAQWVIPRLAIAPVGESRVLTTTVLRATNGEPRHGWIVRYSILNGPAAGLGGSGVQIEEVETDASGQATTIITPNAQRGGTNTIGIQIIRPAGFDSSQRVTVGSEMIRQTWSGNPNVMLNISGPRDAQLGQELHYTITAENRTHSTVRGVVALPIPPLVYYIRGTPPGVLQGSTVLWNVDIPPNSTDRIEVVLRQGTPGSLWLRPEFRRSSPATQLSATQSPTLVPQTPTPPRDSPTVSVPREGATVFHETPPAATQSPTLTPPTPVSPPGASLTVRLEPYPLVPIIVGNTFILQVRVTNTGTADAGNVIVLVPLPAESRGEEIMAETTALAADGTLEETQPTNWLQNIDEVNHQAVLQIPVLSPGKTAQFLVSFPAIGPQGYNVTCTVLVDGQRAAQGSHRIVP